MTPYSDPETQSRASAQARRHRGAKRLDISLSEAQADKLRAQIDVSGYVPRGNDRGNTALISWLIDNTPVDKVRGVLRAKRKRRTS